MLKLIVLWVGLGGREMGRIVVARGVQETCFFNGFTPQSCSAYQDFHVCVSFMPLPRYSNPPTPTP
jgi:hypothetical protein